MNTALNNNVSSPKLIVAIDDSSVLSKVKKCHKDVNYYATASHDLARLKHVVESREKPVLRPTSKATT